MAVSEIESRHDARSQPHRNLLNRQVWLPGAHEVGEVSGGRVARCTAPRSAAARMRRPLPPTPRTVALSPATLCRRRRHPLYLCVPVSRSPNTLAPLFHLVTMGNSHNVEIVILNYMFYDTTFGFNLIRLMLTF